MNHSTIVLKAKFQNIFQRTFMKKESIMIIHYV